MDPRTARLDRSGRLVLPASVRSELELREGDEVVFAAGPAAGEVRLIPRRIAIERAQAIVSDWIPPERRLVDELLRERRSDARRETLHPKPRSRSRGS